MKETMKRLFSAIAILWLVVGKMAAQPVSQSQPAHANPFGRALVPDMIADASIQQVGDTFYCYATTDGYGRGLETSGPPVVWTSKDFVNWRFDGIYFPSARQEKYWAPSKAVAANGRYYIYPTVNGYMHVGVADAPEGPFRLARGADKFERPYAPEGTLLQDSDRGGIDAEVFVDDDGTPYVFWGRRHVARLSADMTVTEGEIQTIQTPQTAYSEGPIFFKRKGIYYYLYTIGGDENYQYYYGMSRTSPLGPYDFPADNLVSTTDVQTGVYGPGHGCVFNVSGTDDFYFAFLEFGRRSTNRQTYVNRLEFNADGTIRRVAVDLNGVGKLRNVKTPKPLPVRLVTASSVRPALQIAPIANPNLNRTEYFDPAFATDGANGSRWMAADTDRDCWFMLDLGKARKIRRSEIFFVRPTAPHVYTLEGSTDGTTWRTLSRHTEPTICAPQTDRVDARLRYLRVKIEDGERGIWEWNVY